MTRTAKAVAEELTGVVQELVQEESTPSVKARLNIVARHVGLPAGRVKKYLYGEIVCPPAHEADAIRAYYQSAKNLINERRINAQMRAALLHAAPSMAFLMSRAFGDTPLSNEALAAATSPLSKKPERSE